MRNASIKINNNTYHSGNIKLLLDLQQSWSQPVYDFLTEWYSDAETITMQTSGSTGTPKTIQLPKTTMQNSAKLTNEFFGLHSRTNALLCLPVSYIAGKMMIVRALTGNFNLFIVEPKSNPFANLAFEVDFTAITPFQLHHSAEDLKKLSISNIIVGGGHINSKLVEIAQGIPATIFETYGMTETASHIALKQINGSARSDCFKVLPNIKIGQDSRACLTIFAPHLHNELIITNDVVEITDENSFRWIGRNDFVINSGGIKLYPEKIEQKLEGVLQYRFFITSKPDAILGHRVVLVIEKPLAIEIDKTEIQKVCETHLDKYEIPSEIISLEQFVYGTNQKFMRAATYHLIHRNSEN